MSMIDNWMIRYAVNTVSVSILNQNYENELRKHNQ